LIPNTETLSEAELARARKIALEEPSLVHKLISPAAYVTGINVSVQLPAVELDREVPEIATFVYNFRNYSGGLFYGKTMG